MRDPVNIILFILCLIIAGYIIHAFYLWTGRNRKAAKENSFRDKRSDEISAGQNEILFQLISKGNLFSKDLISALRDITETTAGMINCERVSIWLYNDDYSVVRCLDLYILSRDQHHSGDELSSSEFPSYLKAQMTELLIAATDVFTDPRTREIPSSYLTGNRIASLLDIPLWRNNRIRGILSLEHTGKKRVWTKDDERLSMIMASIVSLCLESEERNKTEKELYEAEQQLRTAGNNLSGGMIYRAVAGKDGSRKFTFVSAGVKSLHGFTPEQVIADSSLIYRQIFKDDMDMLIREGNYSIEHMTPFDVEVRFTNRQGEMRWIRIISHPRLMKNGDITADGIEVDITERKLSEEKLRKSEENYRNIIDNMQDVFFRTDINGDLVMASPSITNLLGYETIEECIGMNVTKEIFYNTSDRDLIFSMLKEKGKVTDFETVLRRKNGSRVYTTTSSHLCYDADGKYAGIEGIVRDITGRKRAEEMFNRAFNENPCPMSITSLDTGMALEVNKAWLNTMEYQREQIMGITPGEINLYRNPEDRTRIVESLRKTGSVSGMKIDFITRTGKIRNGVFFADTIEVAGEKMLLSTMLDITEQRNAENALKSNEENLRITLDSIGEAFISTDINGRIVRMNPAAMKITGWSIDDAAGTDITRIFRISNFSLRETPLNPVQDVISKGKISFPEKDVLLISKDGKEFRITISATPIINRSGETEGVALVFQDITERYRLERESIQNALSFRTIFEASPYSIAIQRVSDGTYVMINPAYEKNTGCRAEEIIGKNTLDAGISNKDEGYKILTETLKTTGKIDNVMTKIVNLNGLERYIIVSARIIDFNGEPCVMSFTMDITDMRKMQNQLNHAQKMDAIGQLAGGIAHDFNNMLGGIIGATELLQMNADDPQKRDNYIRLIKSTAERASELTAKLLAFSRKNEIELEPVDIHKIIEETSLLLYRTINRNINIKLNLDAESFILKGDISQLMNIFLNLGINAGHAMPYGGDLLFSTRNAELDEIYCKLNFPDIVPGSYIVVDVQDTGEGIPPESIEKIFEPFFTTKDKSKGTGLGLSAVYGSIKQHNGAITVYSEPGRGTIFHLFLPLPDRKPVPAARQEKIVSGKGLVLVVDDEEIMRVTAGEILQYLGYDVLEAVNGKDGIEIFRKEHDRIDIVLLDMIMPVMNGHECFSEMKKIDPNVKVIISSGFLREEILDEMKSIGLNAFIRKPYITAELSELLAKILSS